MHLSIIPLSSALSFALFVRVQGLNRNLKNRKKNNSSLQNSGSFDIFMSIDLDRGLFRIVICVLQSTCICFEFCVNFNTRLKILTYLNAIIWVLFITMTKVYESSTWCGSECWCGWTSTTTGSGTWTFSFFTLNTFKPQEKLRFIGNLTKF